MDTFIAIVEQSAEGCDYTIGCGLAVIKIEGSSVGEIESKIIKDLEEQKEESNFCESAYNIARIRILTVSSIHELDMDSIRKRVSSKEKEKEKIKAEAEERKMYEYLKKKLGTT